MMTGRPRIDTKAYRIIAKPYYGVLWADELWSFEEWERQEHRRAWYRAYKSRARLVRKWRTR